MFADDVPTWTEFGHQHFDRRIVQALTKTLHFERPTFVQHKAIPLSLRGQDLLCKAFTGSGKTLAYLVPVVHRVLADPGSMRGLIIVPTKELTLQVHQVLSSLLSFCFDVVSADYILPEQKYMKAELPSILVSSPSCVVNLLKERNIKLTSLRMLVVDEADLLFSFGYEEDMRSLALELPTTYQAMLCSATLSTEVEELKGLVLHKPVTLDMGKDTTGRLSQFFYPCKKEEKFLVLYALLKLRLLQGKTLVFVDSIRRGYEIKLFLERFAINCSLLNSELSWEARQGVIQAFNQNVVDLCIAIDEVVEEDEDSARDEQDVKGVADETAGEEDFGEEMSDISESASDPKAEDELSSDEEDDADVAAATLEIQQSVQIEEEKAKEKEPKKSKRAQKRDKHFSMTRGLDFIDVDNVLNVDAPLTYRSYIHRVGRTARAGKAGTALSLITDKDQELLRKLTERSQIDALPLRLQDVDRLRYRVEDVKKSITPREVAAIRIRELQQEAVNSQKLAAYFEDNPEDVKALQTNLRKLKERKTVRQHLKYLPSYLVPESLTAKTPVQAAVADQVGSYGGRKRRRGRVDPLRFKATSTKKRRFTRQGQELKVAKEREDANLEELVPLSGRKIWKLNHRKQLKKNSAERPGGRSARAVKKLAKKFAY